VPAEEAEIIEMRPKEEGATTIRGETSGTEMTGE
jgi:hypothetical protein